MRGDLEGRGDGVGGDGPGFTPSKRAERSDGRFPRGDDKIESNNELNSMVQEERSRLVSKIEAREGRQPRARFR